MTDRQSIARAVEAMRQRRPDYDAHWHDQDHVMQPGTLAAWAMVALGVIVALVAMVSFL